MRANELLAPCRVGPPRGPQSHDGSIIPDRPDRRWGTDLTTTETLEDGVAGIFVLVDHYTAEALAVHVPHKRATRFEAVETLRRGVAERFGRYDADVARGIELRFDHGSQFVSDLFQKELRFLGFDPSPAFVRQPEGNGCAERFIRTLKEQLLWTRPFRNRQELERAIEAWVPVYNNHWILERHSYRTPAQARRDAGIQVAA